MPTIFEADATDHLCPYNDFKPCFGAACMGWSWLGPQADRCETDNLVETEDGPRPVGTPPTPEGEGWVMDGEPRQKGYHQSAKLGLPKATAQRWVRERPRAQGQCARHPGDDRYGPW
jgi:hypothetical protein